jgi:hypothetical protein
MSRVEGFNYSTYPGIPAGIENVALSDTTEYKGVKGFIANATGTLAVRMEDGSEGTIPVVVGLQYSGSVLRFKSTGTVTVTGVTIFY